MNDSITSAEVLDSTDDVAFIQPTIDCVTKAVEVDAGDIYKQAKFLSEKDAKQVKIIINAFIREGKAISHEVLSLILGDEMLANYTSYYERYSYGWHESI